MNKRIWLVVVLVSFIGGFMADRYYSNDFVAPLETAVTSIELGGGWTADDAAHTWTLSSTVTTADADVYVVNVDADVTGYIGANMKVRLEDGGTVKYFGILSVGAYSAGVTPVYLFGGTDYVLSGTITEFSYSSARAPFGFPLSEDKWAVEVTDATDQSQTTPTITTWYNINSNAIILPAGDWDLSYRTLTAAGSAATAINVNTTLSTSSSSESDSDFRDSSHLSGSTAGNVIVTSKHEASKAITVASDTTYYLLFSTNYASVGSIVYYGSVTKTRIRAVWGGL